jgi:D-glycero-beta-D-manno-heptose-7-phosphate kinase
MSEMKVFHGISENRLKDILNNIRNIKVAVIGDMCLDIYWKADMTKSELSRETPHFPLPIVEERMSPGAGGNTAANIAALAPSSVIALGVIGKDWRGDCLTRKFKEYGIATENIIESEDVITNAYCKPVRTGISNIEYEDPRLDFCNYKNLPCREEEKLIEKLEQCISKVDILCVSDQFMYGCISPKVREKIISFAKDGIKVVVDSRDRIGLYKGVILKPNEVEGVKAVNEGIKPANLTFDAYVEAARKLSVRNESKVCMTLGDKGCIYANSKTVIHIPSYATEPPIDICGAGDTFMAAFSCAIAAGAEEYEAASFANLVANVTIKKVGSTGTASPEEIIKRYEEIFKR